MTHASQHQSTDAAAASRSGSGEPLITVAVAGNPNSGKTCLFNGLTGGNQTVGNYPGVTVDKKEGYSRIGKARFHVVDLPGTYSLTAYSQDELVARQFVIDEQPDVVVDVLDATNLERNLYLALQLIEMGVPMVFALNMVDIAHSRGLRIDVQRLSELTGIPVAETVANRSRGIREVLHTAVDQAGCARGSQSGTRIRYDDMLEVEVERLAAAVRRDPRLVSRYDARWVALKLLEEDEEVVAAVRRESERADSLFRLRNEIGANVEMKYREDVASLVAVQRYQVASRIVEACVHHVRPGSRTLTDKIDAVVCHRGVGLGFVALSIYALFKAVFFFAEQLPWLPFWDDGFAWKAPMAAFAVIFDEWLPPLLEGMAPGAFKSLLLDGVIGGVGGVMEFVPLIFVMFFFLSLIEDSGYIARIAFLLDRALYLFGLQGKSIVALIVSGGIAGGCAVPGVMATRTMREEKDRLTTMLVAPFMNCGAKMPVYTMLIAAFFAAFKGEMLWLLVLISWAMALCAAFILRKTVIKGEQTPFVLELPPYHVPHLKSVLLSSIHRTWQYMKKAGTIILGVNVLLWALMYFPRVDEEPFQRQLAEAGATLRAQVASHPQALLAPQALPRTAAYIESLRENPAGENAGEAASLSSNGDTNNEFLHRFAAAVVAQEDLSDAKLSTHKAEDGAWSEAARKYLDYREQAKRIRTRAAAAQLKQSFAGRLGHFLSPVTRLAGFEWKTNIALIGGFAAKEVIVSTLGTAYSMGAAEVPESVAGAAESELVRQLRQDWTPLQALTLMIFVMLYAPCIVTITVLGRESGHWKWALFSTAYNTALAFTLAVIIYQTGSRLGLGI